MKTRREGIHRTKGLVALIIGLALVAAGCSGGGSGDGDGDDVTLSVSTFVTEGHPISKAQATWMERVTELTDGSVTFEEYYDAALCTGPETLACITDGKADIGMNAPVYNPEMLLANVGSVLFQTDDLQATSAAIGNLYKESDDMQAEYESRNQRLLWTMPNSLPQLVASSPVKDLGELEGKDIRGSGSVIQGLEVLGANPVFVEPQEIYESLDRGVLQGATFALESVADYRLTEVAKHIYDIGRFTGNYAMLTYAINNDAWESLTEDQKKAMEQANDESSTTYVKDFLVPAVEEACKGVAEAGLSVEEIGPESAGEKWAEEGRVELRQAFIDEASKEIDDAEGFFEDFEKNLEKFATDERYFTADICGSVK